MKKSDLTLEQIINSAEVQAIVVDITPDLALKMLERNVSNRPVSKVVVDRYADNMKKGLWQLNAQSIVFNNKGELTDGQHRLYAVVQSGCTIESLVAGGVAPEAFSTYDCGRNRNLSQLIGMSGVKHYAQTASIVTQYLALTRNIRHYSNEFCQIHMCSNVRPSNTELLAIYNENAEKFNYYGERSAMLSRAVKKSALSPSFAGAVWMFLVESLGYDNAFVQAFFLQLFSYDSSPNSTIDYIRKKFLEMRGGLSSAYERNNRKDSNYYYTMPFKVDLLTKAWNLYATGKQVKVVSIKEQDKGAPFITPQQAEVSKS